MAQANPPSITRTPTVNVAGDAAQTVISAMADAKKAHKRQQDVQKRTKAANGTVTANCVAWATEIRVQMGERKIAVGGADEYTAIRRFLVDNKVDKGQATNMSQLVSWLVNDETLIGKCGLAVTDDDGKPTGSFVGWNVAHAKVKAHVNPPARSWKDALSEAAEEIAEESDAFKAWLASLSGREVLRTLKQRAEAEAADGDDDDDDADE